MIKEQTGGQETACKRLTSERNLNGEKEGAMGSLRHRKSIVECWNGVSGRGKPKEVAQAHRDSEAKGKSLDSRASGLLCGAEVPKQRLQASMNPSRITIFMPC